jgi:cytochrome c biogenesis protein CcmG, thiol:disulfide interchange protein DsbE
MRAGWYVAALALLSVPTAAGAQVIAKATLSPGIVERTAAPEIDLPTLDGGRTKLSKLRGHPVVITFWGTWCPPCRDEFPELVSAYRNHRDVGLEVIAVNQRDQEISTRDVEDFVKAYSVEFIVALDPRGRSRRDFRLVALPTTVFVDAEGVMQTINSGPLSAPQLAAGLATIIPAK